MLTQTAQERYFQGRTSYLTKHLNLMKTNQMNECKNCEMRYHVRGNVKGQCAAALPDGVHEPAYDFEKDPTNVLNCEI